MHFEIVCMCVHVTMSHVRPKAHCKLHTAIAVLGVYLSKDGYS